MSNTSDQNIGKNDTADDGRLDQLLTQGEPADGYLPEEQAPPIEWENLRALAAGKLPTDEFYRLTRLTALFRSWSEAMGKVLGEQVQKPKDSSGDIPPAGVS